MSAFRILHLSDIHIGKTYKPSNDIAYQTIADVGHNGLCSIKSVIVTGDIFDGNANETEELINEAVLFFETLMKQINLNQKSIELKKDDFVFVPGNHDLVRDNDEEKRWGKYNRFLSKFFGTIPTNYDPKTYTVRKYYDENKIAFIGFNSCELEKKKVFDTNFIETFEKGLDSKELSLLNINKDNVVSILKNKTEEEFNDFGNIAVEQLANIGREVKENDEYKLIALFHHHFDLFPEISRKVGDTSTSIVRNHTELKRHLNYMNVKAVLHGHKHFDLERPHITDDYYTTTENIIHVFAGGSIGTDRVQRHTFSVIDFYDKQDDIQIMQHKFVYNGERLEPIEKKQIPPYKSANRNIKLLELLASINPSEKEKFEKTIERINKTHHAFEKISSWIGEAFSGFEETSKFLHQDYRNLLFLLYAINFRTLAYKKIVGQEISYFESTAKILKDYFDKNIMPSDFEISSQEYHTLFEDKKLKDVAANCDQLLKNCNNRKRQLHLAFSMVGIFFADLYLVLTEYADDFTESIKYKVNISIKENKFHENVPAPRIVLQSASDRRSIYIQMLCNEPTAHKIAVLFVKEFDIFINKFEDYFKLIGLKLYYLLPKIDKNDDLNTLDNYNFEAYIPTLLPLLTGDNIYPTKVVFARELIQNSIDAIAVRQEKELEKFPTQIDINIGRDDNDKRYFMIKDNGTGMDRFKIERYFTSIGRSFYSGDEYSDLNISYKPISSFGIGFLSSFMVCKEIEVKTKYYLPGSESLKLNIPNYDGCFFIQRHNEEIDVGTELKLFINQDVENKHIVEYIKSVFLDVKYDIKIKYLEGSKNKEIKIKAHQIRKDTQNSNFRFFVPFTENFEILSIDYEKEVLSNEFLNKYEYGMLITETLEESGGKKIRKKNHVILNSGILVEQAMFSSLFDINNNILYNNENNVDFKCIINFPADWIQLDVSREKLTGITKKAEKVFSKDVDKSMEIQIVNALSQQIESHKKYVKENRSELTLKHINQIVSFATKLCENSRQSATYTTFRKLHYKLNIDATPEGIMFEISDGIPNENILKNLYKNRHFKVFQTKLGNMRVNNKHSFEDLFFARSKEFRKRHDENMTWSKVVENVRHIGRDSFINNPYDNILETKILPEYVRKNLNFFQFFALALALIPYKNITEKMDSYHLIQPIENLALDYFNISDVENGKNKITVTYEELINAVSAESSI